LLALLITFQNSPYTAVDNVNKNYIQSQFAIKKIKNTRWPNFAKAKINLDKPTIQDQFKSYLSHSMELTRLGALGYKIHA